MKSEGAEVESGGLERTLKDLFAGAAGGVAQVMLGEFFFWFFFWCMDFLVFFL